MRVNAFVIEYYRSIKKIVLSFPKNKPLILFGPNNAGKSNILSALNIFLGEKYPTYTEMKDSDFFQRNLESYPNSIIGMQFSEPYHKNKHIIYLRLGCNKEGSRNFYDEYNNKLFIKKEERIKCQSILIEAVRNMFSEFNYSSSYSILSKFSKKIHEKISKDEKEKLSTIFSMIRNTFDENSTFEGFFNRLQKSVSESVAGFTHSLEVDFSAYDPNNYAKSMRIQAIENDQVRGFEEFGTGEQQILLMAFIKAYMETFIGESFVLIIEEPEAHLHPLAQKWLKEYIYELCEQGIQIVVSTHSSAFLDFSNLEGMVRVYKAGNITEAKQISADDLCSYCEESGVPSNLLNPSTICDYYATRLNQRQIDGFFADVVLLVEGNTELLVINEYCRRLNYKLPKMGIEIVVCEGKNNIPLMWRLYRAFGYLCFAVFDADGAKESNDKIFHGLIPNEEWEIDPSSFKSEYEYGYFGKDLESYMENNLEDYHALITKAKEEFQITGKPGLAKFVATHSKDIPEFMRQLVDKLDILIILN